MNTNFSKLEIVKFRKIVKLYKLLYNQYTLKIMEVLVHHHQLNVTDIKNKLNITQSQTSQYLSKLRKNHIVITKKKKHIVYYSLNTSHITNLNDMADRVLNIPKT